MSFTDDKLKQEADARAVGKEKQQSHADKIRDDLKSQKEFQEFASNPQKIYDALQQLKTLTASARPQQQTKQPDPPKVENTTDAFEIQPFALSAGTPLSGGTVNLTNGTAAGQILYWDATVSKWTILNAPSVDSILTFAASGSAPVWQAIEACS